MLHRPGPELKRLTPRNNDKLLFDGIPWVHRAQDEHDAFAAALSEPRGRGALPDRPAHRDPEQTTKRAIGAIDDGAARASHLGDTMRATSTGLLQRRRAAELAHVPHRRHPQRRGPRRVRAGHRRCSRHDDFLIDPLPNLLFTRDSSVWVRDRVAITSLAMPARERETQLTELIYTQHPRFAGTPRMHGGAPRARRGRRRAAARSRRASPSASASGPRRPAPSGWPAQVLPGRTSRTPCSPCRSRRSARPCTSTPICTMVDVDKIVMYPNVADSLTAYA